MSLPGAGKLKFVAAENAMATRKTRAGARAFFMQSHGRDYRGGVAVELPVVDPVPVLGVVVVVPIEDEFPEVVPIEPDVVPVVPVVLPVVPAVPLVPIEVLPLALPRPLVEVPFISLQSCIEALGVVPAGFEGDTVDVAPEDEPIPELLAVVVLVVEPVVEPDPIEPDDVPLAAPRFRHGLVAPVPTVPAAVLGVVPVVPTVPLACELGDVAVPVAEPICPVVPPDMVPFTLPDVPTPELVVPVVVPGVVLCPAPIVVLVPVVPAPTPAPVPAPAPAVPAPVCAMPNAVHRASPAVSRSRFVIRMPL